VATNGCFDILHPGHLLMLERARELGGSLLVGVTGDEAVRLLKGNGRPSVPEQDRILMLAGFEAVSFVCLFPEVNAVGFLEKARPNIYVKGNEYTIETIDQDERLTLANLGTRIEFIPMLKERSTSILVSRILKKAEVPGPFGGR
jgi:D-beta-D-heptose 7-phosphate kinase/D-beta-D-heptose 1-phosphate adenosyltransferase